MFKEYNNFLDKKSVEKTQSLAQWREEGPRTPQTGIDKRFSGSGRVNCIAISHTEPNKIWAGAASGGLWKSTNRGEEWAVVPFTEFLSIGISDIQISKSDPNIMYAATGDVNGGSFFGCYSIGLIKSTDAGNSWDFVDLNINYEDEIFISKVLIDPKNANIVYMATSNSILKTTDGGISWIEILDGYIFRDLMFKPDDSKTIYATTYSVSGKTFIFMSDDGGDSWYIVKQLDNVSRIKLATTPLAPDYLLALCVDSRSNGFGGLYLSRSAGIAWEKLLDDGTDYNYLVEAQGFFNLVLEFSRQYRDVYYIGGVWLYQGDIKSNIFVEAPEYIHVDQHDIKFNPNDKYYYLANDGGVYRFKEGFYNIENISSNLGITQFYRIGLHPYSSEIFYGGSQDNNLYRYFYDDWQFFWGGDGMESFLDPRNPSLVYYSTQRGNLFSTELGPLWVNQTERRPWVTSFLMHPLNNDVLFCGYENVWRSSNRGYDWERISDFQDSITITSIALSSNDSNSIYASNARKVYKSSDAGKNWNVIYESNKTVNWLKEYDNMLWLALGNFDETKRVLLYYQENIENHTFNLPNIPINCIEIDTLTGRVYIGTDFGVFDKLPKDTIWQLSGKGLPAVIINELEIHYASGRLFAATFGRGIWSMPLFDCTIENPKISTTEQTFICPNQDLLLYVESPNQNYTYIWQDGRRGESLAVSNSGVYYVSAISNDGCAAASDTIFISKINGIDISVFLLSQNPICIGDTAKLLASFRTNQAIKEQGWSDGQSAMQGRFTSAGNYYYFLKDAFNCIHSSDTVSIKVNPLPEKPNITKQGNWLISSPAHKYSWYRNGVKLSDYTGQMLHINQFGSYVVVVSDSNFCFNQSEPFALNFGLENEQFQYRLYPNPFVSEINLELNLLEESDVKIMLFNSIGQLAYKANYEKMIGYRFEKIDLSHLAQSTYFIRIETKFGTKERIIVKMLDK